ncbi:hypothetical protein [Kingella negevensis]|uniref:Lipoprotein n=1 Tax=Kingella negevensis TaxID=1522312 RepID=A0A238TCM7_9NEIS|nr:hypothetical protein [Kingella negevensis]MDK4679571.1 hypothetical protein [Kingella negevensis]MDK4682711.1 hypothetical protein [Kingella negevensis]MDK4689011.1 hypothetical protein [Kingella negevensis]MDK4690908.1 hypothetical protein [Kingella negevensis]MDK4693945.1 hypothetical protein [Kingella negevensis]
MKKILIASLAAVLLNACATTEEPQRTTRQKVIRAANLIVYTPLCIMYGICPDISDDE